MKDNVKATLESGWKKDTEGNMLKLTVADVVCIFAKKGIHAAIIERAAREAMETITDTPAATLGAADLLASLIASQAPGLLAEPKSWLDREREVGDASVF